MRPVRRENMVKFIAKELRTWWHEPKIITTDNPPKGAKKIAHPWFPNSYSYGPNFKTRTTDVVQAAGILASYVVMVPISAVFVGFKMMDEEK